jgi:acyl carrier protein
MNDERAAIQSLFRGLLDQKGDHGAFGDHDSLVLSGRLDSIDVLEIVTYLEANFGVNFADGGFDQRELDSVDAVLARVERERVGAQSQR